MEARRSGAWRIVGVALVGLLALAGCAGISGERAQEVKWPPKYILLLVAADHETGGLSITDGPRGRGEWVHPGERELWMILSIRCSLRGAERRLGKDPSPQRLDGVMADCFPGFELPEDIWAAIAGGRPLGPDLSTRSVQGLLGLMVARNTLAQWGSSHHTTQPVPVVAIGVGAEAFRGSYDNTDFARKLLSLLGE